MRSRIEKMIDEGYRVHHETIEERDKFKNMRFALSQLEHEFFNNPREDGTYPDKPAHLKDN